MEDPGNGSATNEVVEAIGIHASSGDNRVSTGCRTVFVDTFLCSSIASVEPSLILRNTRIVRHCNANENGAMAELGKVANDAFDAIKMSLMRARPKA